ncbi:MAG: sulfotransferase [Pseudomonadota bacterium]|nr:sulfotransferase [Pseudomonadota bacterium]
MKVVVAGLGRAGTQSIVAALKQLGLRTMSQEEVLTDVSLATQLVADVRGDGGFDWSTLEGMDATVGWPLCFLYTEQLARWPDAKCLLNVRDPDAWFDSMARAFTVLGPVRRLGFVPKLRGVIATVQLVEERMGGPLDRERWIAGYHAHVDAVRASVPPERLLVYDVKEGWEPLCQFLDLPVPDGPFPRTNSSESGGLQQKLAQLFGVHLEE